MSPEAAARQEPRIPRWGVGLIMIGLVIIGFYLAFAKSIPFTGKGYELHAVFENAQNVRKKSPVRVAGVNIGEVTKVEHVTSNGEGQEAALVTMEIKDEALPIGEDATVQLRPRLFLEGNLFVDLKTGTPQAEDLESGSVLPIGQSSSSVQLDQVLTSLQAPVREQLQTFLVEFGNGLDKYGGAEGFREVFKTSPAAFRYSAQVNEAFLGTQPGDLSGLIVNFDRFVRALNQNEEQLKDLITNLRTFVGSLAAEDDALQAAITELPGVLRNGRPALFHLNQSLPSVRAFAREALPGVRSSAPTLKVATPFVRQLRALASRRELRGLTADLSVTVPDLARLARGTIPFLEETRALSSCFSTAIVPWADQSVDDPKFAPTGPVYQETAYGLVGIAGESRAGDGNGQYIRVAAGGGPNTVAFDSASTGLPVDQFGATILPLLGARPALGASAKTPFRPDEPCENQEVADLGSGGAVDPPDPASSGRRSASAGSVSGEERAETREIGEALPRMIRLSQTGRYPELWKLQKELGFKVPKLTSSKKGARR